VRLVLYAAPVANLCIKKSTAPKGGAQLNDVIKFYTAFFRSLIFRKGSSGISDSICTSFK
jgi:hypothetical protein